MKKLQISQDLNGPRIIYESDLIKKDMIIVELERLKNLMIRGFDDIIDFNAKVKENG